MVDYRSTDSNSSEDEDSSNVTLESRSSESSSTRSLRSKGNKKLKKTKTSSSSSKLNTSLESSYSIVKESPTKNKSLNESSSLANEPWYSNIKVHLILFLVVIIVTVLCSNISDEKPLKPRPLPQELFLNDIQKCENMTTNQDKRMWKELRLTTKHLSDNNPGEPFTVMFASTSFGSKTRENFAKMFASAYSRKCSTLYHSVDGNDYKSMSWEVAKKRLDDDIKRLFLPGHSCALVVSNFHLLPPRAAELFFGLCDNDNADYKNATIIFTVEITHDQSWDRDGEYGSAFTEHDIPKPNQWDIIIDTFLTESLKSRDSSKLMDSSRIAGLMSRVLATVLWVQREDGEKCQ